MSMGREASSHDSPVIVKAMGIQSRGFLNLRIKILYLKEKEYGTGKSRTARPRNTQEVV